MLFFLDGWKFPFVLCIVCILLIVVGSKFLSYELHYTIAHPVTPHTTLLSSDQQMTVTVLTP